MVRHTTFRMKEEETENDLARHATASASHARDVGLCVASEGNILRAVLDAPRRVTRASRGAAKAPLPLIRGRARSSTSNRRERRKIPLVATSAARDRLFICTSSRARLAATHHRIIAGDL